VPISISNTSGTSGYKSIARNTATLDFRIITRQ
jgi:hypothetical protein